MPIRRPNIFILAAIEKLALSTEEWSRSIPNGVYGESGRRVPKFGFKNINRVEYKAINLDTIQKLAEAKSLVKVGINDFIEAGFISSNQLVKVLGNGTLTKMCIRDSRRVEDIEFANVQIT